jgi:hypothetical protein
MMDSFVNPNDDEDEDDCTREMIRTTRHRTNHVKRRGQPHISSSPIQYSNQIKYKNKQKSPKEKPVTDKIHTE